MLRNTFTWLDEHYDKIAVEEAIQGDPAVRWTILRLPMVYAPGDPLVQILPAAETRRRWEILHTSFRASRRVAGAARICGERCAAIEVVATIGSGSRTHLQHL